MFIIGTSTGVPLHACSYHVVTTIIAARGTVHLTQHRQPDNKRRHLILAKNVRIVNAYNIKYLFTLIRSSFD